MNKFSNYKKSISEDVRLMQPRKFVAGKGHEKISIETRSDNGLTITVESNGKTSVYVFDSSEMPDLERWLFNAI